MKYIVVTGGIISGLGKGITASSIGLLLKSIGFVVTAIKIDPYLNIDAGTMSPYEHGECYVLSDGSEVDLDMGNYERFIGGEFTNEHNITTGKIYDSVLKKERKGSYLGKTVQIVPHVTDEIKNWISRASHKPVSGKIPDVCIIELGGTVGDMEILPFIEAIRQMSIKKIDKFCFVHVVLIVQTNGEYKTKPAQDSIHVLRKHGIVPNLLVLRVKELMNNTLLEKIENTTGITVDKIIQNTDSKNIYYVPDLFKNQKIIESISTIIDLNLDGREYDLQYYYKILNYFNSDSKPTFKIAIAGKYTNTPDTYLSIIRSIEHSAIYNDVKIDICWIDTKKLDEDPETYNFGSYDGFIIPGGFGNTGIEGKLQVAKFCRQNSVPLLGICLGFQIMVIDCFTSLGLEGSSTEFNLDTPNKIIDLLPNQNGMFGGTMRLGDYDTYLIPGSQAEKIYASNKITERHRHRYEVNNKYIDEIEKSGLKFSGFSVIKKHHNVDSNDPESELLMEVIEMDSHPFYVGCQYHPEFKTRYDQPHPLFVGLIDAIKKSAKIPD